MTVLVPGDFGYTYDISDDERHSRQEIGNALQTYLERMSGEQVRVQIRPPGFSYEDKITWVDNRGERGRWEVRVTHGDLSVSKVMRLASTMLFTINKGVIESVTKRMTDRRVKEIADTIEMARTEWLGDMWFNANMFDETRVEQLSMAINAVNKTYHKNTINPDDVRSAVRKTIYDVPGNMDHPILQAAMVKFGPEIKSAVRSLDQSVALNLAVDIADYLNWRENPGGRGGPPGDETVPSDQDGQGGKGGQGVEPGDSKSDDKEDGQSPVDKGRSVIVAQGGGGEMSLSNQSTLQQQPPDESDFESETFANRKRIKTNIKRTITRRKKNARAQPTPSEKRRQRAQGRVRGVYYPPTQRQIANNTHTTNFSGSGDHSVEIVDIGGVPTELDEYTKLTLGTYIGNRPPSGKLLKRGRVSPSHAWKLSMKGDTRIFQRPPVMKGHVSILVDISGSMGCWCNDCAGKHPEDLSAYLAWQVSGMLGQLHPTAEVFAYSGGRRATSKIVPLGAGEQPNGCARKDGLAGGTPTCTAMLYFRDHLMSRPSNTTAIIITDGGPDPCYGSGMQHVDHIGYEMMAQGIKFGTVFIGGGRYLTLPAEVSVNVTTLAEIANVQPLLEILDR